VAGCLACDVQQLVGSRDVTPELELLQRPDTARQRRLRPTGMLLRLMQHAGPTRAIFFEDKNFSVIVLHSIVARQPRTIQLDLLKPSQTPRLSLQRGPAISRCIADGRIGSATQYRLQLSCLRFSHLVRSGY
jgi:hypothetical protein